MRPELGHTVPNGYVDQATTFELLDRSLCFVPYLRIVLHTLSNERETDSSSKRKLQCSYDKCHRMHVGSHRKCESLFIEHWDVVNICECYKQQLQGLDEK